MELTSEINKRLAEIGYTGLLSDRKKKQLMAIDEVAKEMNSTRKSALEEAKQYELTPENVERYMKEKAESEGGEDMVTITHQTFYNDSRFLKNFLDTYRPSESRAGLKNREEKYAKENEELKKENALLHMAAADNEDNLQELNRLREENRVLRNDIDSLLAEKKKPDDEMLKYKSSGKRVQITALDISKPSQGSLFDDGLLGTDEISS